MPNNPTPRAPTAAHRLCAALACCLPLGGAPATPDADQAREAAERELQKPLYHPRPNIWQQILDWFLRQIDGAPLLPPGLPRWASVLVVCAAVALLLGVLASIMARYNRVRRRRAAGALFDTDLRDSHALVRDADNAAASGDFVTAVVDRFRAVIRSLDERNLLEDYPGMTAHEASQLAGAALEGARGPDGAVLNLRPQLFRAGDLFDAVRYGDLEASDAQDQWMRGLAAQVEACVPVKSAQPVGTGTGVGL